MIPALLILTSTLILLRANYPDMLIPITYHVAAFFTLLQLHTLMATSMFLLGIAFGETITKQYKERRKHPRPLSGIE